MGMALRPPSFLYKSKIVILSCSGKMGYFAHKNEKEIDQNYVIKNTSKRYIKYLLFFTKNSMFEEYGFNLKKVLFLIWQCQIYQEFIRKHCLFRINFDSEQIGSQFRTEMMGLNSSQP